MNMSQKLYINAVNSKALRYIFKIIQKCYLHQPYLQLAGYFFVDSHLEKKLTKGSIKTKIKQVINVS